LWRRRISTSTKEMQCPLLPVSPFVDLISSLRPPHDLAYARDRTVPIQYSPDYPPTRPLCVERCLSDLQLFLLDLGFPSRLARSARPHPRRLHLELVLRVVYLRSTGGDPFRTSLDLQSL
jgi:hypothetical protein